MRTLIRRIYVTIHQLRTTVCWHTSPGYLVVLIAVLLVLGKYCTEHYNIMIVSAAIID